MKLWQEVLFSFRTSSIWVFLSNIKLCCNTFFKRATVQNYFLSPGDMYEPQSTFKTAINFLKQ
jgi:hypothetical protein